MARTSTKKPTTTMAQLKKHNEMLTKRLDEIEDGAHCSLCDKHKPKDMFYMSTDPLRKSGTTPICKQCATNIARRVDDNGKEHSVTRESLIKALRYLDKPFLETIYNSSIQESESSRTGRYRDVFFCYMKNVSLKNYNQMTFENSDMFTNVAPIIYEDEKDDNYLKKIDKSVYDQYITDKEDVKRLIGYDPFLAEPVDDQPFLYSQLLGMLDRGDESNNDDMMRTNSIVSIVRNFLQIQKIDAAISVYMIDAKAIAAHASAIKSLNESKQKLQEMVIKLAAESCISLKNSRNAKKGENTWTGKLKKLKDLNIRDKDINGFDIGTCKGMTQVAEISAEAMVRAIKLDDSDYADIVAEQREKLLKANKLAESYKEALRILLIENLDLRENLIKKNMISDYDLINLDELVDTYIGV